MFGLTLTSDSYIASLVQRIADLEQRERELLDRDRAMAAASRDHLGPAQIPFVNRPRINDIIRKLERAERIKDPDGH